MIRAFLVAALLALATSGCEGRKASTIAPAPEKATPAPPSAVKGQWILARTVGEDARLVRLRTDLESYVGASHPYRLEVTWAFVGDMPDNTTLEALDVFEDRLTTTLEPGDVAVLAIVVTGAGKREWTFHAKDRERALSALRPLLKGHSATAVEAFDDATGSKYGEFMAEVKRQ